MKVTEEILTSKALQLLDAQETDDWPLGNNCYDSLMYFWDRYKEQEGLYEYMNFQTDNPRNSEDRSYHENY